MIVGLPKSVRWGVSAALLLLTTALPLHAMDEETAKTIADLKAQMQSLMDEVKKLKSQQSTNPLSLAFALPHLRQPIPTNLPSRLHLSPLAILLSYPKGLEP